MDLRIEKRHDSTYDLFVGGRLMMHAESFAVVDGVQARLLGLDWGPGELQEIANSIKEAMGLSR